MLLNLKIRLNQLKKVIIIKSLYLLYTISKRSLKVISFSTPDPVIIYGNPFALFWEIKGCYKITLNDLISLPGNTSLTYIDSSLISDVITIRFHGIKSKVTKTIHLNTFHATLNGNFHSVHLERELSAPPTPQLFLQKRKLKLQYTFPSAPSFRYSFGFRPADFQFMTKNLSRQIISLNSYSIKNNPS